MIHLRGNTFLLLLLRAGSQILLNPQEYGESKNGITRPNMLADLIRMANPAYNPAKIETLATYFSKYLSGDPPRSPSYLPFNDPAYRYGLQSRLGCASTIQKMDAFCRTYLSEDNFTLRLLVAGLVDAVLADDSFDGEFMTGMKTVKKEQLGREKQFLLQPFLLSVWSIILSDHPDTKEGKNTYLEWTTDAGYNSPREISTQIGAERAKKIAVSTELPEEVPADTAKNKEPVMEEVYEEKAEADETEPTVEIYEAPYTDPRTQQQVVAQFHVEAKDNGIAIGQVNGGLVIGKRGKDE